jgi:hypothetical protein
LGSLFTAWFYQAHVRPFCEAPTLIPGIDPCALCDDDNAAT